MSCPRVFKFLIMLGSLALAAADSAHAYLDPGTGSYIFQIIIAFFIGALFAVKHYFRRIKSFLMSVFSRGERKL